MGKGLHKVFSMVVKEILQENESIMMSEQYMYAMNSGDESDHDLISTEMLKDICDRSQTHPNVNRREAHYKIRDRIRQRQLERKGVLKATLRMGTDMIAADRNRPI